MHVARPCMSNYIPEFYMDVITYPCPNLDGGFSKSLLVKEAIDQLPSTVMSMVAIRYLWKDI